MKPEGAQYKRDTTRFVAEGDYRPVPLNANHRDADFLKTVRQRCWRSVRRNRNAKDEVGLDACRGLRACAGFLFHLVEAATEHGTEL